MIDRRRSIAEVLTVAQASKGNSLTLTFFLFFLAGSYSSSESGEVLSLSQGGAGVAEDDPVSPRWAAALLVLVGGPLLVGLDVREVVGSKTAS